MPDICEVRTTVLKKDPKSVLSAISLRNGTVQRRIEEIACDSERNLQLFVKYEM